MNLVFLASAVSILVFLLSIFFLLVKRKKICSRELFSLILLFYLVMLFHFLSDLLQEMGISLLPNRYEEFLGLFLPIILFLIAYMFLRELSERSLLRYKHIISSTHDHMAFIDFDYRYRAVNKTYLLAHNKSSEEVIGHTVAELMGEDVFNSSIKNYIDQCLEGKIVNSQSWFDFPDTGKRFMDVVYHPYSEGGNSISGIVVSSRDITDLMNAQTELSHKTLLLETILQRTSETAIVTTNQDLVVTFINARAELLFGCKACEVVDRRVTDIHKELAVAPELLERALEAVRSKGYVIYTYAVPADSGDNLRYIESRLEGIIDPEGKLVGYSKFSWDVTEKKQMENQLLESEKKARALMNATKDYAMLIKPDGSIVAANQAVLDMYQLSETAVVGKTPFDFLPAVSAARRKKFLDTIVLSKKPMSVEDESMGKFFSSSAYPILDSHNEVTLVALFIQDITERKISEEAIQKRERYLKGLNEATQLFLVSTESVPYQKFLNHIGPIAGASRTYIFLNHIGSQGELLVSQKAEWCSEGISPEIDNPLMQNLSYVEWLPRWIDSLTAGKLIHGRVAEFPDTERALLEPQNILAILIIPIHVEQEFVGFVGYDNCTSDREWDEVEKTFLRTAANDLSQAIRRIRAENKVLSSLREKEVLLREIHHRVKNNMQVVTSLLSLQARSIPEGKALDAIKESQRRISTISQVHETLYISDNLSRISMKKYLTAVLREINNLYSSLNKNVLSSVTIKDINLTISDAIPLGLITSELVTNAFKHAFPAGQEGVIDIALREIDGKIIELVITDDGIGMPENTNLSRSKTLGLQIVYNLVKLQLRGSIRTIHKGKTIFVIQFARSNGESSNDFDVLARSD